MIAQKAAARTVGYGAGGETYGPEKSMQWRAWQDSNPQPLGPKPSALSVELQAHDAVRAGRKAIGASNGIRTRDLLCHRQAPWTTWLCSPQKAGCCTASLLNSIAHPAPGDNSISSARQRF